MQDFSEIKSNPEILNDLVTKKMPYGKYKDYKIFDFSQFLRIANK